MTHENFSENTKNELLQQTLAYRANLSSENSLVYALQICRLTLLKASLNFLDHKEVVKEEVSKALTGLNLACFWLTILPFIWFVLRLPSQKEDPNLAKNFVSTNLPGLSVSTNFLNWETVNYPFDYTEKLISSVSELSMDSDLMLLKTVNPNLELNTLLNFEHSGQSNYLKEFSPRDSKIAPLNLDEIPEKLKTTRVKKKKTYKTVLNPIISDLNSKDFSKTSSLVINSNSGSSVGKIKVFKLFETNSLQAPENILLENGQESVNPKLKNWHEYLKAQSKLNDYFRRTTLKLEKKFVKGKSVEIIQQLTKKETKVLVPRAMTGYNYPDLFGSRVLQYLRPGFNFESMTKIPLESGLMFSMMNKSDKPKFKEPVFSIESNLKGDQSVYFVEIDQKTLDVKIKNRFEVRSDIVHKISKNNIATTNPVYFFGQLTIDELKDIMLKVEGGVKDWEKADHTLTNLEYPVFEDSQNLMFSVVDPHISKSKIQYLYAPKPTDILGNPKNQLIPISLIEASDLETIQSTAIIPGSRYLTQTNSTNFNYPFNEFIKNVNPEKLHLSVETLDMESSLMNYSEGTYARQLGLYWLDKVNPDKLGSYENFKNPTQSLNFDSILTVSLIGFFMSMVLLLRSAYADYAKELSSYLLDVISSGKGLPLDQGTVDWLNEELGLEEKKGGIRVFPKGFSNKRFTEIAGIKSLLPELSELVWFLRNKQLKYSVTRLTHKSVLFVGPPGTGKTLLVQTLASEADVPVIAQSTNMLSSIGKELTPADAIRMAFDKARALSPSILFLDELDSLGTKRDSLLTNPADALIQRSNPYKDSRAAKYRQFYQNDASDQFEGYELGQMGVENASQLVSQQLRINLTNQANNRLEKERDQVSALTQLLVEIDGLQGNDGVLVIGATNRPGVLDPALIRPGRFSKIIPVPLPDKTKRIEIIKLYAKKLGWKNEISWDYLSKCTQGFSAGDLAAMTNQSAIQAILNGTQHTLETFEHGIKLLTTYPTEKLEINDPFILVRESYYKSSKVALSYYLNSSTQPAFLELTTRQLNVRAFQILANTINDEDRLRTRIELETILISLLAGKAGELLLLLNSYEENYSYWESDLAKQDLYEATKTAITMIQEWYFYSDLYRTHLTSQFLTIPSDFTHIEFRTNDEVLDFLKEMSNFLDQELTTEFRLPEFPFTYESLFQRARWKVDMTSELTSVEIDPDVWTRFHLPDPQETERNAEWIPPEQHHSELPTSLVDSTDSKKFNSTEFDKLLDVERDRFLQALLLLSFNKAFEFLDENRERLDALALALLQKKFLRDDEIQKLLDF